MSRPISIWLLIFLLLFLGLGGLYGGVAMLIDPSGSLLELTDLLSLMPVSNFVFPGLFLFLIMGIAPIVLVYGLLTCPNWRWTLSISSGSKHHWSWTGTVLLGFLLALWLTIQGLLIGFKWTIQYITAINGCLIIVIAFLPKVRGFYKDKA